MGVDLPDEHVVARGEIFVFETFVLHDDGLPLRDQHVDTPVKHRHHHGERTFQQQHVVEHPSAHKIHLDTARVPLGDRGHAVERHGGRAAPQAAPHEAGHRVVAAHGGQDREHDERHDEVIEQLQQQFRTLRRTVVEFAVIELLAVVAADLRQHRMGIFGTRQHQIGHDAVAGGDAQPAHAPRRDVNAVAVLVDEVAVPVGMHREHTFVSPLHDPFAGRPGLVVAVQVHEHQQHVGEIDHQADRHGDQQIQNQIGVFGLQFHGVAVIRPPYTTMRKAYSRGPCGG